MCAICGATQVPVCAAVGPCTATIQHLLAFGTIIGAGAWYYLKLGVASIRSIV